MAHYTVRVGARAALARELQQPARAARAQAAGLTGADLEVVAAQGEAAREADREQHEQLAQVGATRSGRALSAAEVRSREDALRARLPVVVHELEASDRALAAWLGQLSFARYRLRELALPVTAATPTASADPSAAPVDADVKKVTRVEREDLVTRTDGLAAFCEAITKPEREPIVAKLTERGLDRNALVALGADADALARAGRNVTRGVEATAREATAAAAQQARWRVTRRMFAAACAGDPDLATLLASC